VGNENLILGDMGCKLITYEMKIIKELCLLSDYFLLLRIDLLPITKAKSVEGGSCFSLTVVSICQDRAVFTSGEYRTGWFYAVN